MKSLFSSNSVSVVISATLSILKNTVKKPKVARNTVNKTSVTMRHRTFSLKRYKMFPQGVY